MDGRVVIWISRTFGKGFTLKAVVLAGALTGALISGVSFKIGQWFEKRKAKNNHHPKDDKDTDNLTI